MSTNTARVKAKVALPIGLDNIYVAELIADTAEGTTYKAPEYLARAIKATLQPILAEGLLESEDAVVIDESQVIGYTVSIEVSQLDDHMRALLFGHRRDASGGIVVSENDESPELALLFRTALSDKQNYKYTALYKGRFKPNEESNETKKKESITYGVEGAIEGNFYCRASDGTAKYSLRSDQATAEGKTKIASWFTEVQDPDAEDFTEAAG